MIQQIATLAQSKGIRMHLDGARLWNACAATGISPHEYARHFDSVSVCLSKGLGAPVGSVIVGSKDFIGEARHYRKIFGGGMRQAGILAAAGLYALEHNMKRLSEDHSNASCLARTLADIPTFAIDLSTVQTNIILIDVTRTGRDPQEILAILAKKGVLLTPGNYNGLRAVTHLDVTTQDVETAGKIITEAISEIS
jgi:threonine aldolase